MKDMNTKSIYSTNTTIEKQLDLMFGNVQRNQIIDPNK